MKIIIDKDIPFIDHRFPEDVETLKLPAAEITNESVRDADVLIIRTRTRCDENLLADTNIKLIATATIGMDHIDSQFCEKSGIKVVNAPGCNAPGVAQYVLASIFKAGFDTSKDTLGIIGYGNVGSVLAEWAAELGIKTMITDAPLKSTGKFPFLKELPEVLENSKVVTLHVPFTKTSKFPTYRLIDKEELTLMKPGSILINSSRGGVVNEKALIPFLKEGKISAMTDVWENEPEINQELLNLSWIATPHIAGYSLEGKKRATYMVLRQIENLMNIKPDYSGFDTLTPANIEITSDLIVKSYDPEVDSATLKANPANFEKLRNNYKYRHEPLFKQ